MTSPQPSTQNNLINDFHKILELFDRETQIYKQQISIYKNSINELQNNDANRINIISRELSELRNIINNLDQQIPVGNRPAGTIPSDGVITNTADNTIGQTNNISSPTIRSLETNNSSKQRDINDYLCQICLDLPRDCLLEPCMHFCVCVKCVKLLTESKCPVCRRTIEFYQNVFIS